MATVNVTSGNGDNNVQDSAARVLVRTSAGIPYVIVENQTDDSIDVWKGNSTTPTSFTEQDTSNNPTSATYRASPAAAIDASGVIHIAFYSFIGKSSVLRYVIFSTSTDTFSGNVSVHDVGSAETINAFLSISIDANDIPYIAWVDIDTNMGTGYNTVFYTNRIGGSWSTPVEVEGKTNSVHCRNCDIAIDVDNLPVISYNTSAAFQPYRAAQGNVNNASSFTIFTIEAHGFGASQNAHIASIAVDSTGNHHVAYVLRVASGNSDLKIRKHTKSSAWTSWETIEVVDSAFASTNDNEGIVSLVIDGTDRYIFVEDPDLHDVVYYVDTGGGWGSQQSLETGTYNTVKAKWAYFNNFDSAGKALIEHAVYHFDGSDASPSDPEAVWANDTNIDDGSESTTANNTSTGTGTVDFQEIEAEGTNAPASGSTIDRVYVRIKGYTNNAINTINVRIFTDARGQNLDGANATINNTSSTQEWSKAALLTTPSGGWTWPKVQALQAVVYKTGGNGTAAHISKIDIRVETDNSPSELDYSFTDETASKDILWNILSLTSGTAWTKDLTEAIVLVDAITFKPTKALTEVITLVDTITKTTSRAFTEILSLVDTLSNQAGKTFSEVITLVDVLGNFVIGKLLTEAITLVDTLARIINRTFTDAITLVDTVARTTGRAFTEAITLVDDLILTPIKTLTETITLVDVLGNFTIGKALNEVVTLVDDFFTAISRTFTETVTLVDTVSVVFIKTLTETITLVDTVFHTIGRTLTDTITLVDTVAKNAGRVFTEAIALVDTLVLTPIKNLTETVTLTDTVSHIMSRTFTEAVTLVDNFFVTVGRTFSEVVTLVDGLSTQVVKIIDKTELITLVDTLSRTIARTFSETIAPVDDFFVTVGKTFTETLSLVDTITLQAGKLLSEVVTLIDTITKTFGRTFPEAITLVDTVAHTISRTFTEVVSLTDTITRIVGRTFTEAVSLVDTLSNQPGRSFSEIIALVDTLTKAPGKVLTDALVLVDSLFVTISRVFTETLTLVDTISNTVGKTFTEAVTLADNFFVTISRLFTETITLTDIFSNIHTSIITGAKKGVTVLLTKAKQVARLLSSNGRIHHLSTARKDGSVLQSKVKDRTILPTKKKDNNII